MSEQKTVTRNGIALPLRTFKIVKGDNKDKEYLAPNVNSPEILKDQDQIKMVLDWFGIPNVFNELQTRIKKVAQDCWFGNIDKETGQVNIEVYLNELADFTSSGLKLKEIRDRIDELQAQLGELVMKMVPDAEGKFDTTALAAAQDLQKDINILKAQAEKRSRKGREEKEDEPAVAVGAPA